jgi:uncharacterized protein
VTKRLVLALSVVFLAGMQPGTAHAQKKNPKGTPILILSGGQREHHGYRDQALTLSRMLEDTGRYRTTIAEDACILEAPAMAKYELIILTVDRRDDEFKFTIPQQKALFEYVRSGHGLVSIHGADNAPKDWLPEWKEMLGGIYSHFGLPDGKARKGTYPVKVVDTSNPITRGLSDFTLTDELYYNMQMLPDVEPLLTAEFQGKAWPVAWTRVYGKGRVFHTNFGHRDFGPDKPDPLRDPNLGKVVVQGIDWVAGK